MKGAGCRDKGSRFERKVAAIFDAWSGSHEFSRAWLSRGQDDRTDDLKCPAWFSFIVSCKHVEGWSLDELFRTDGGAIREWWAEISKKAIRATAAAKINQNIWPLLVFTRNRAPIMVACPSQYSSDLGLNRMLSFDWTVAICRLDEWLAANPASRWKGTEGCPQTPK